MHIYIYACEKDQIYIFMHVTNQVYIFMNIIGKYTNLYM
jgi:hypothetical protein